MSLSNQQYRLMSDEQRLYIMYTQLETIAKEIIRLGKFLDNRLPRGSKDS